MILWRFNSRDKIVSNKTLFIVYEQRAEGQDLQIKDVVIYCNHCFHVIVMFIYFCFIYPCYIPWFTLCRQAISYTQRLSFKHVLYSRFSTDFDKFFEARFEKGRLLLSNLRTESLQVCQKSTPFSLFFRLCHKFVSIHVLTFSFCKFQHIYIYVCGEYLRQLLLVMVSVCQLVLLMVPVCHRLLFLMVPVCHRVLLLMVPVCHRVFFLMFIVCHCGASIVPVCYHCGVFEIQLIDLCVRALCQNIFNRSIKLQKTIS